MFRSAVLLLSLSLCGRAAAIQPGKNKVTVRGQAVEVYFVPATAQPRRPAPEKVLFAPGDGGWRGLAIDMAQAIASWGYDVYGLDTKQYLQAFTNSRGALKETEVGADLRTIADSFRAHGEKVILAGWSEGAGLCLLGAAGPGRDAFSGFAAIGLGEDNVLGWRTLDDLTWVTRRKPSEPTFLTLPYMPKVAPLRLAMLHSTGDEYTTLDAAKRLFSAAAEPKRLHVIDARNHRFDGGREQFYSALRDALQWMAGDGR